MWYLLLAALARNDSALEREWIRKIARGDQSGLESLYDAYAKYLYSFILSVVKKETDAEDVLQEVFLQVWEKSASFDINRGNVYTWIVTITRSRAVDRIRSKGYRNERRRDAGIRVEELPSGMSGSPLDLSIIEEQAGAVRDALISLPEEQRAVITTAYFGGFSQTEIAEKFNIPLGTVKTRMRLGMKRLQEVLAQRLHG